MLAVAGKESAITNVWAEAKIAQLLSRISHESSYKQKTMRAAYFFLLKNGRIPTHAAEFIKKFMKFARKFKSVTWEPIVLREFVQIVNLTVAFFDSVSNTSYFYSRTMEFFFHLFLAELYGGYKLAKKKKIIEA